MKNIKRGEIYLANLNLTNEDGSIQKGIRPVLIYSNNTNNKFSPTVQMLPISSSLKKLCVHVFIEGCGLSKKSVICAEQIRTISKNSLIKKIGKITDDYMELVNDAVDIQLGRKRVVKDKEVA